MSKYKAVRSFKVQGDDGVTRMVQPGESVPEAESWRNVKAYIERNWICRSDEEPEKKHYTAKARVEAPKPAAAPAPATPELAEPEASTGEDSGTEEFYSEKELNSMSKRELKELAKEYGLDSDQSKSELVASLLAS